jgi:LysR family transcriptional regulator, carnitine catabolism transcriptional activator
MNLSHKHLRAFVTLAQERNFTRAAERCHLSQPAFSTLMRNLELQAGVRLFNRSTRMVELTPEGRVFEATAARLLQDLEGAFGELRDHVERRKGRITVAALPSIAGGALPPVIAAFLARHPGIEVTLKDITADDCLEAVRSRQADFALAAAMDPGADLSSEPLLADSFHLVCREDHALARRRQLALRDVARLPQISFHRESSIRQHIDAAFYPAQPVTRMEVTHPVTAAGLAASGVGVVLVPTLALFQFRLPGLVAIPVKLPIPDREICLIRRKGGSDSVAAAAFVGVLKEQWRRKTGKSSWNPAPLPL